MTTWLVIWPVLFSPFILLSTVTLLPTFVVWERMVGGGPIREWLLNYILLPVLPHDAAVSLVHWFNSALVWQEWLLATVVAININALVLPILYCAGLGVIRWRSWAARADLDIRRSAINR